MIANHPTNPSSFLRQGAYTLTEVLVVVAMIGILSTIAVPSYQDYTIRGKIPDATANLAAKRVQIEQFFMDNRTYDGVPACNNDTTTSQNFVFFCSPQDNRTYTLWAMGKNTMAGFTFTVDQNNAKQTTAVPLGWSLPNPNNCWITKKGGVC